jgi:hypothetical protein
VPLVLPARARTLSRPNTRLTRSIATMAVLATTAAACVLERFIR